MQWFDQSILTIWALRPSHILHVYIIKNFSRWLFCFPLLGTIIFGLGISLPPKPPAIFKRLIKLVWVTIAFFIPDGFSDRVNWNDRRIIAKMKILKENRQCISMAPKNFNFPFWCTDDSSGLMGLRASYLSEWVLKQTSPDATQDNLVGLSVNQGIHWKHVDRSSLFCMTVSTDSSFSPDNKILHGMLVFGFRLSTRWCGGFVFVPVPIGAVRFWSDPRRGLESGCQHVATRVSFENLKVESVRCMLSYRLIWQRTFFDLLQHSQVVALRPLFE